MAGFTTLALIGLAGAAGLIGGKKLGQAAAKNAGAPTTPAPTDANTIAAPPPPTPTTQSQSNGVKAGQQAAQKVKRKMVAPVIGPRDGTFSKQPVRGFTEAKTLIGSGY